MHLYVWSDGIYCGLRSEDVKLCALVLISANGQGQKKLLAISDGVRESTQNWHDLLLDLKERSFNAPKVALDDGSVGLWAALDKWYPQPPLAAILGRQEYQRAQLAAEISAAERKE